MRPAAALALLALLAACTTPGGTVSPPPDPTTSSTAPSSATTPTATTTTTPTATATSLPSAGCPQGDVLVADGQLLQFQHPASDGSRIAGVSWRTSGTCQVVSLSFATADGAPATTPPALTARLLREAGVLRVETGATDSVVIDQLVEEGQVERLFVPVDGEGLRFVDLVLSGPTVARGRVLTSPARLELELQPGGPDEIGRPLMTSQLVVVEPGSAAAMEPILDVSGYSTGRLEDVHIALLDRETTVTDVPLALEDSPGRWSAFHLVVPMGDSPYDTLHLLDAEGSVIAGIPFSR